MKRIFIGLVIFSLIFSLYIPIVGQASDFEPAEKKVEVNLGKGINDSESNDLIRLDDEVGDYGYKGDAIKLGLRAIQQGLKAGDWILAKVEKNMSLKGIAYLRTNTQKVNAGIDKAIAKINDASDYVQSNVRGILFESFRAVNIPDATAMELAENISATLSYLLL